MTVQTILVVTIAATVEAHLLIHTVTIGEIVGVAGVGVAGLTAMTTVVPLHLIGAAIGIVTTAGEDGVKDPVLDLVIGTMIGIGTIDTTGDAVLLQGRHLPGGIIVEEILLPIVHSSRVRVVLVQI